MVIAGTDAPFTLDDIEDGLARDEFYLEYLPTIELDGGRCCGAEALLRWRTPQGVRLPDEFLPVVHGTPVLGYLTLVVMEMAVRDMMPWMASQPRFKLGLNVPPEVIGRGGLRFAFERMGLRAVASQLIVEVTERGVPDAIALSALEAWQRTGVRVALDDLSALGSANALVLARGSFTHLKIDRSLVASINTPETTPAWLGSLRWLLENSSLRVIAEGVETADQAETLRRIGVHEAQGYLFSQPLAPAAMREYFASR